MPACLHAGWAEMQTLTFWEAKLLCDSAGDLGGGGVAVQIHLFNTLPVNMAATQL